MLKIIIIQGKGNVTRSPILFNGEFVGLVEGLPGKLSTRLTKALNDLKKKNVYALQCDDKKIILLQNGSSGARYGTRVKLGLVQHFVDNTRTSLETVILLHWYLNLHIVEMEPGKLDGKIICNECKTEQLMNFGNKCGDPGCPSHAKWKRVDNNYVLPDVFKRAQMGIPQEGNANSWAQKG